VLELLTACPTAVQAVEAGHETADRTLEVAPVGLGTDSIDQLLPSSPSASAAEPADPTAVHSVALEHDTPESALVPGGFGADW